MNRTMRYGILAFAAALAFVTILTMSAVADPIDTNNPPTEDWVFDSGMTTTIKNKIWTIEYSITVTDDSVLQIEDCTFTFDSANPMRPVFIYTDDDTTLSLQGTTFTSEEGSPGFYIECHDNVKIVDCEFVGLVANPAADGGISVYGNEDVTADFAFLKVHNTVSTDGLYFKNCQVKMANCIINDTQGNGVVMSYADNSPQGVYNVSVVDSEVYDTDVDGIDILPWSHYGVLNIDFYYVEVHGIGDDALVVFVGDGTSSDRGNGSVYATFDHTDIYDVYGIGMFLSSLYQVMSNNGPNEFNATYTNSSMYNCSANGLHCQYVYTTATINVIVENVDMYKIALEPTFTRNAGIFWWWGGSQYSCNGRTSLYIGNSSFDQINPYALYAWDFSGNDFYLYNTTISRCVQAGINQEVQQYQQQSPLAVEMCEIHHNDGNGIYVYAGYMWGSGGCLPVKVSNSSLHHNGLAALAVSTDYYPRNYGFNVTHSKIYDQDSPAIEMGSGNYPDGPIVIHVIDSWINNTAGIRCSFQYDSGGGRAGIDLQFINSSIENTTGTAISLIAKGYSSIYNNVLFVNSTIRYSGGDGINYFVGTYGYKDVSFVSNGHVIFLDSVFEDIGGMAIALNTDMPDAKGNRTMHMVNVTIQRSQRAIYNLGFKGNIYTSEIKNSLKEDIFLLYTRMELWYVAVGKIDDSKFKALDGAEILFYYTLDISVKWDTGAPAVGANVQIFDNKQTLISVMPVPHNGILPTFTMNPYFVRETGVFGNTPYIINASFLKINRTVGVKLDSNKVVTIILEDHIDPQMFLLYPKEGHVQQSTTLQVRGSAWDEQSGIKTVLVSLDGVTWETATGRLRWNHTFEVNSTLIGRFSGIFNLRAKAVDNAGNEKIDIVQIRIDPTPPELTLNFPKDGYRTNNPDLWVRGVTELGSQVEINSVPVEVVVSMFTHKVRLVEGPNTISVISIDPLGNIQIERLTVYLDTQKPYVILVSPEEKGAMTNEDTILIEAQVEEALDITVNGYPVPYGSEWYPEGAGVLTYEVSLEPGDNVIVIQARDTADNLLVIDRVVTFDTTPPWIQVISPVNDQVLPRPEVTIVGTVDPTATLLIDGEDVTVVNGYFERVILALEGGNTILLEATDFAGNSYEEELVFFIDTVDPTVRITAPKETMITVNEVRQTIEGTTAFTDPATGSVVVSARTVLLNGESYTYIDDGTGQVVRSDITVAEDGTFSIPVDLLEGRNEFTIEVRDDVGNRATATRVVMLDTRAPTLVMYIDPIIVEEDGTISSHAFTVNITGYTDPGSTLMINDILLPVDEDGLFKMPYDLAEGTTTLRVVSVDSADNEREIHQDITYVKIKEEDTAESSFGLYFLLICLVILVAVAIFATYYVRKEREDWLEMEAAGATPLAPMPVLETVVDEPDTLPGPDEIGIEDEELEAPEPEAEPAPTTAPARPRPRPPQARRAVPRPVPKEKPVVDEKDLQDQASETDLDADETDQEGI